MRRIYLTALFFIFNCLSNINLYGQVSIINANINEYNITPASLSQISLSNNGGVGKVKFEIILTNSANNSLLSLSSNVVHVKQGLTVLNNANLNFTSIYYASSSQGQYLKNLRRLPSGAFNYCVRVIPVAGFENGDEYCQSLNTSENENLILVNPYDEEVIETKSPMLMWLHTESFNLLSEGEFFRLTLVEVLDKQSSEEALLVNTPKFLKNYVSKHQVQYPLDASKLEEGRNYAWNVQKIANGNILASTETWSFTLAKNKSKTKNVAITLKTKLDGTVYHVNDDMIFFRFDERYKSSDIKSKIFNDKREEVKAELENKKSKKNGSKSVGYNSYKLDLEPYNLKKGYYTLEVLNEKNEKYLIKFYVE